MKQLVPKRPSRIALLPLAMVLAACTPDGEELEGEDPGSAAPDLTSETSPPPVPPLPDADTAGLVNGAPRTP